MSTSHKSLNMKAINQGYYNGLKKVSQASPYQLKRNRPNSAQGLHSEKNHVINNLNLHNHENQTEAGHHNQPYINENLQKYISGYSTELQHTLSKILIMKPPKVKEDPFANAISAASKVINIPRNIQTKIYIKSASTSEKIHQQKEKIRRYMKENDVDIMHLNAINTVFLDCDSERTGVITRKSLFEQIAEQNLQFPADFLFNLIQDVQENPDDQSEDALLSYQNLRNIIEIYSNCPLFLKGDSNNSDNFKNNMDLNKEVVSKQERIDKLLRYVHCRIEEKFKGFRQAFRSFDRDFGGSLDFKEFIQGMECIGVKLKLDDYRLIFETIDYDKEGSIDFTKFCLLNTDKKHDLKKLIEQKGQETMNKTGTGSMQSKKPPLAPLSVTGQSQDSKKANPLFGDGNIPKNKDLNRFTLDIQSFTPTHQYMQERKIAQARLLGFKTYEDVPQDQPFGSKVPREHDMVALLRNSYSDNLNKVTVESLRQTLQQKKLAPSRPTYAQALRDKATRIRYGSLNALSKTRSSQSISRGSSQGSKRRNIAKDLVIRGNKSMNQTMYTQPKLVEDKPKTPPNVEKKESSLAL